MTFICRRVNVVLNNAFHPYTPGLFWRLIFSSTRNLLVCNGHHFLSWGETFRRDSPSCRRRTGHRLLQVGPLSLSRFTSILVLLLKTKSSRL